MVKHRLLAAFVVLMLAAGCSSSNPDSAREAAPPGPTTTSLAPALASAKGWLAYQIKAGAQDRIWLTHPDGSDDHQAFLDLPGRTLHPDFSHNGKLAFDHQLSDPYGTDNVYVANADGKGAQLVATCKPPTCIQRWYPAWSPDNKQLAVATASGLPIGDNPPPRMGIAIINLAKGTVVPLLDHSSKTGQDMMPRWSPDGRQLVFYRWRGHPEGPDPEAALFLVNVDGSGLHQLTPWKLRRGDPDWSPDGSRIVCATRPPTAYVDAGPSDLYVLRPDGSGLRALTNNGPTGPRATQPRFTPDGTAILHVRTGGQDWNVPPKHLYLLDLTTGNDTPYLTSKDISTRPTLQPTL
jgi:TolB protein